MDTTAPSGSSLAHRALIAVLVLAGGGTLAWYIGVGAPAAEKQRPLDTAMFHAKAALNDQAAQFRDLERVGPMVCGEVSSASRSGGAPLAFYVDVEAQPPRVEMADDAAAAICRLMREHYARHPRGSS